ncbi:MAG: beta-ketoacyl-ACP synthase II [Oscillospiraceae bacterium]|nr:beta-ketoacyl-ACP synthase II [Oscillospiraceae bacterium]MCR5307263.1 beta-ketoacyl-ACP synthase II [Oscillospiraceae bacterium]
MANRRVAVTGMGAVTPIGCDLASFWAGLCAGKNGIDFITRFDASELKVKLAAEVKDFDPKQVLDAKLVRQTDRYQQYALAAAEQAVQDAGIAGKAAPERFGVYFGSGIGGFETFVNEHNTLLNRGPSRVSPFFITKMISNMAAGQIAIRYGAQGPCLDITTACATGTNTIGEAMRAIRHGYADVMIAGGADAVLHPLSMAGFINCQALTESTDRDAASIPFDKRRSGFVMGEGAGVLVLEEYEHAVARGAHIYAEVAGYGSTCDAFHVTAPDGEAKASSKAIADAFAETGFAGSASEIYINAHGTSTLLNDKTETAAIKRAFGEETARALHISSTKSMTGHLLGAAGAVEAIAAVKALETGIIPPTINYKEPDPDCDLDITPNTALHTPVSLALSTSLGFGGHNACIAFKKI